MSKARTRITAPTTNLEMMQFVEQEIDDVLREMRIDPEAAYSDRMVEALGYLRTRCADQSKYDGVKQTLEIFDVDFDRLDALLADWAVAERRKATVEELGATARQDNVIPILGFAPDARSLDELETRQRLNAIELRPLGTAEGRFYFLGLTGEIEVFTPSELKWPHLGKLATHEFWSQRYPHTRAGVNWIQAADELMQMCRELPMYETSAQRGAGVTRDGRHLVVHLGDKLVVDGKPMELGEFKGKYTYFRQGKMLPQPDVEPASQEAMAALFDLIANQYAWRSRFDGLVMAGALLLAPICGALEWRTHVWLNGMAGAGKTEFFNQVIHPLLGAIALKVKNGTTEPGIRQALGSDARPVVFDEFEIDDANPVESAKALGKIMRMARNASSESDASVLKGGANAEVSHQYQRAMFIFGSISVRLSAVADIERVIPCTLLSPRKDDIEANRVRNRRYIDVIRASHRKLIPDEEVGRTYQQNVLRRLPQVLDTIEVFCVAAADCLNGVARLGKTYGTALAGAWLWTHTHVPTYDEALTWLQSFDWAKQVLAGQVSTSGEQILARVMLEKKVRVQGQGGVERSIGDLVFSAIEGSKADPREIAGATRLRGMPMMTTVTPEKFELIAAVRALNETGIKVEWMDLFLSTDDPKAQESRVTLPMVVLADEHSGLAEAFANTESPRGWNAQLSRMPLAIGSRNKAEEKAWSGVRRSWLAVPADVLAGDTESLLKTLTGNVSEEETVACKCRLTEAEAKDLLDGKITVVRARTSALQQETAQDKATRETIDTNVAQAELALNG